MVISVPASTRDEGTLIDRTIGEVAGPTFVGADGPEHEAPSMMPAAARILIARTSDDGLLGAAAAPATPGTSSGNFNRPAVDEHVTHARARLEEITVGHHEVGNLALLD